MNPARVFLVEDHQMLREGIRVLLASHAEFITVGEAGTCREAQEGVRAQQPDFILLDFKLPDGDGLSLLPVLRRAAPEARIIVLCGAPNRALVRACFSAGAGGFISKDAGGREILDALRAVSKGETYLSGKIVSMVAESLRQSDTKLFGPLSGREIEVLRGIAAGLTYKEIAHNMGVGLKSVETYKTRLARKTGLRTKVALAQYAAKNDLTAG